MRRSLFDNAEFMKTLQHLELEGFVLRVDSSRGGLAPDVTIHNVTFTSPARVKCQAMIEDAGDRYEMFFLERKEGPTRDIPATD